MSNERRIFGVPINRNRLGWVFYDFADSAFVTVIVTVVYSVYFKNHIAGNTELGTALWGRAISISMAIVALMTPFLGAVADQTHRKKSLMFFFCAMCVVFTALLYIPGKGDVMMAMLIFIVANVGFNASGVFYNGFLPELADRSEVGRLSGLGWGFGYVGGLIALVASLLLLKVDVRLVFPMVALFHGGFATITFVLLKEKTGQPSGSNFLRIAFHRVFYTLGHLRRLRELAKFLLSFLFYNDGISAIVAFAAIYGASRFDMSASQLVVYFILAQFTSILGAWVFGPVLDRIGAKRTITITIGIWIAVLVWTFFCRSITEYYFIGLAAGLAIGSSQSASRSMMSLLTPDEKSTEFFGFYSLSGRFAAIFSPLVYGEVARISGGQRASVLTVIGFFVIGGILLQFVDEKKGRLNAEGWSEFADE
jgi:MFS transporter, UMF1 family